MTLVERLEQAGIRRLGSPKGGFRYRRADGRAVTAEDARRIRSLRIPPAWRNVAINPSAKGRLQAVGLDRAGRWQYRYHPSFMAKQQERKYQRLLRFAKVLPELRARVCRALRSGDLSEETVTACVVRLLAGCVVRPGSEVYASENGHFGITTLRHRHVKVRGDTLQLDFPGKAGKVQHREVRDRLAARVVRRLLRAPGRRLFRCQNQDGEWVDIRRRDVNAYIKAVMGEDFSAKDFRTWAATLICACALSEAGCADREPKQAHQKKVLEAIRRTASTLGNTPAVCRASYISPSVLSRFDRGRVIEKRLRRIEDLEHATGLLPCERSLLKLLGAAGRAA